MTGVTEQVNVMVTTSTYLFVPLAAVIAAIGVAGGAYVIRNMVWTEGIFVANDFWRGIKQNFGVIVGALLLYSIFFVLSKISLAYTDLMLALGQSQAWLLWIAKGATYIVLALATVMVFWMISMGVTYQLSFWKLIKNAFLMTISLIPTNIFFCFESDFGHSHLFGRYFYDDRNFAAVYLRFFRRPAGLDGLQSLGVR